MTLHEDKFVYIFHRHTPNMSLYELPLITEQFSYSVTSSEILYPVKTLRDLGITVSSDMSWSKHIHNVATRAKAVAS